MKWLAQELLTTFQDDIGEVALIPQRNISGTFIIRLDDKVIWDRKNPETVGFPELKDIKNVVRDRIAPQKKLGHSEIPSSNS